jgi:hypothetical protein
MLITECKPVSPVILVIPLSFHYYKTTFIFELGSGFSGPAGLTGIVAVAFQLDQFHPVTS